nr:hypothetical protein BaRGS_030666 [Batillaria attramentaria]
MEWKTDDEDMDVDDCYYCWSLQEGVGTGDETATSNCDTNNPDEGSSTQPKLSKPRQGRGSVDPPSKKPESTEKLLIFTMGEETYTPHLIGIKRMRLQDVLGERAENGDLDPAGEVRLLPNVDENLQGMDRPRDDVDHMINMHGHIVGMALSPDHRYLYVNSRQWPQNYSIQKVLEPPPIAQEIDIHVIDLQTLTEVGTIMRSHKAYTPNDECFFLFLDISDRYVASVAFNPKDEEMLVTVSDDFKIKIWRSRRAAWDSHFSQDTGP